MVAEGWTLFGHTCEEVGPAELPQLLRQLKGSLTPEVPATSSTPTAQVIPKTEQMEEQAATFQQPSPVPSASPVVPVVRPSGFIKMPIMIKLGPHSYEFKCGNCNFPPRATKHAMDAHIHGTHTKKALLLCAPSVISVLTTWIHSRDMRRSTSRVFLVVLLSLG